MKSSLHTPSPTKTALAAVISGCRYGLLWDAILQSCPCHNLLSRCSQDQPTCSTGGGGELMRWGKAGSCGARWLIRVVAMFVLCSLYLGREAESVAEWQQRHCHPPRRVKTVFCPELLATLSSPCKTLLPQREQTGWGTGLGTLGVKLRQSHPSHFKL